MSKYYGDLHVHIGYSEDGMPVKITGSKDLNFANIAHESLFRKGLDIVGVVDCASPRVLKDIKKGINEGVFTEIEGGGLLYKDRLLIILGSEIELSAGDGAFHVIAYLPTVESMEKLSKELSKYIKNINLSTQKAYMDLKDLVKITDNLGGIIVPAHVFTPHKGIYGNCTDSLESLLGKELFNKIPAIELGLSGNTYLASFIEELDSKGFLSNSDAHSTGKIGREYNLFDLENLDFQSYVKSLSNKENNSIIANYGLNPKLGKYHRTYCCDCDEKIEGEPPVKCCNKSPKHNIVMGVFDRIWDIKTREISRFELHPPYYNQVPLDFLKGLGKRTLDRLLNKFGTEMNILHDVDYEQLRKVVSEEIALQIIKSREGLLDIASGGGGKYGRVKEI